MATSTVPMEETTTPNTDARRVLVCLPVLPAEQQQDAVQHIVQAFQGDALLVAGAPTDTPVEGLTAVEYTSPRSPLQWVLAASDYTAAAAAAQAQTPGVVLVLGSDASTLPPQTLRDMADTVASGIDLAVPRYPVGPHDGLVSSALLYPLNRALYGADIRFPLPVDAALSPRLLTRLASIASRMPAAQGTDALIWAVAEAAIAGMSVRQIDSPERRLPSPPDMDLNALLAAVVGALFGDIEAKASFWQRARVIPHRPAANQSSDASVSMDGEGLEEVSSMLESFRLASANLGEIWSIVLPPQSLLALKKLAAMPVESFRFDPALWARTVYDFALAFHGRTLNRGHLLGAMTPLYLAWVASHLRLAANDPNRAARWIETNAEAFEQEKPYFVARWRWPDRFNP